MEIREATIGDVERVLKIMEEARRFQRSLGFRQWEDGYPSETDIRRDILTGDAFVFTANGKVAGYAYLPVGDAAYDALSGTWMHFGDFGVIHRLAVASEVRGKGFSAPLFKLMENTFTQRGINLIRVDTGEENKIMQNILSRAGYECRGLRHFPCGDRLAYEKQLQK